MKPDKGSEDKLMGVYPPLAIAWVNVRRDMYDAHNVQIRVTEGLRTFADQSYFYSLGRSRSPSGDWIVTAPKKVVTHARAGESFHEYGLALDSCFMCSDPYLEKPGYEKLSYFLWNEYGRLCKKHGLEWGGDWPAKKIDRPHCEVSFGLTIHDLQMIHESGGIDAIWNKCKYLSKCGSEIV